MGRKRRDVKGTLKQAKKKARSEECHRERKEKTSIRVTLVLWKK